MSWKSSTSRMRSPSGSVILGDANVSQSSQWRREKAREMRRAGCGPPTEMISRSTLMKYLFGQQHQLVFAVPDNAVPRIEDKRSSKMRSFRITMKNCLHFHILLFFRMRFICFHQTKVSDFCSLNAIDTSIIRICRQIKFMLDCGAEERRDFDSRRCGSDPGCLRRGLLE